MDTMAHGHRIPRDWRTALSMMRVQRWALRTASRILRARRLHHHHRWRWIHRTIIIISTIIFALVPPPPQPPPQQLHPQEALSITNILIIILIFIIELVVVVVVQEQEEEDPLRTALSIGEILRLLSETLPSPPRESPAILPSYKIACGIKACKRCYHGMIQR